MTIKHNVEANVFAAQNAPLPDEPIYNAKVAELTAEIRDGEITPEEAATEAIETLTGEVFGELGGESSER